jgi:hypothetical protein
MDSLKFWSTWKKNYKAVYLSLLILLISFICISAYFQIYGLDNYAPFDVARKTESINVALQNVEGLSAEYTTSFKSYIIFQTSLALKVVSVRSFTIVFLCIFVICFAFLAAATTYLSRLWFLISQALFVIWIITLKIPYLQVLGIATNYLEYALIIAFLGLGYILHAVYSEISLGRKFIAFLSVCLAFLALIFFTGNQTDPILFVAHHAIIVPIIVSFIFIGNVAYDIILSLLSLLSAKKSAENSSNLIHFLIMGFLYLFYVCLTFFRNDLSIQWEIIYLDEFLLLAVSTIIGIWGFKKRSELIKKQLDFTPLGAYVYLVMAMITFATIAWLFATANDALIETFEDVIIFSHLGFGIGFLIFVVFNYFEFLRKGFAVNKIVWQPKRLPTAIIRIVGFAIVILLVMRDNYTPYFQSLSGYYNSVAAYYSSVGKSESAKTSYQVAKQYASTSHHSNFHLGLAYYNTKDWTKSSYYFGKAIFKRPSVQAFINRTQAQLNAGAIFEALFTLEDAQRTFPKDPFIYNMKGLVFEKLNQIDSAYFYFNGANKYASKGQILEVSLSNQLALLAKNRIDETVNLKMITEDSSMPLKVNLLANANARKTFIADKISYQLPSDSMLTYNDFSLLFNLLSNESISSILSKIDISPLLLMKANEPFAKSLLYAMSVNNNYASLQKKSYSQIYELENAEISDAGYYYLIHGFWLMDQGAYSLAVDQFNMAKKLKVKDAGYYKAMALIKDARLYEAALSYDESTLDDATNIDQSLKSLLDNSVDGLSLKYKYLWYTSNEALSLKEKEALEKEFRETRYEDLIYLKNIYKGIKSSEIDYYLDQLMNIKATNLDASVLPYYYNLKALALTMSKDRVSNISLSEDSLTIYPKNYRLLYSSFLANQNKDKRADSMMYALGMQNVFFEEGILQSVNYFNNKEKYKESYTILVEAARLNPSSLLVLKLYILQSLRLNMTSYAMSSLAELANLENEKDYQLFLEDFNQLKDEINQRPW